MPLIPEHLLDEIQARADLAELIGRYVPLKRAGRHFKGLCPFHKERTPSFHVNTDKQIFHCFGCGVGGNVFSFLMQQERLTFPEAVRQMADQVGIEIPVHAQASHNGKADQLLGILDKAMRYYERMLAHPALGRSARAYLRTRGVTDRTREAFRLGYAPGGGTNLLEAAKRSKIAAELLEQAGLTLHGVRGVVDRFRQRLLFPIQDVRGRVVGFGGRSLAGQEPKYLNSPETSVYTKGRHLFGLAQAKDAIAQAKTALVVEGYFDCVLLWQAGCPHVVSPLGTAFTPEQAKLLRRYTTQVVLAFDADAAGETAALRGIDVLVEAGFQVRVAQLPPGVDPDELVRSYGLRALEDRVAKALGILEFLLACAAAREDLRSPEGKVRAAQLILPTIAKIPDAMLQAEYVRLLAERLHLDERAVTVEMGKVRPRSLAEPPRPARRTTGQGAERLFTALIVDAPSRWDALKGELGLEQISDPRLRQILATICEIRTAQGSVPAPAQLISRLTDDDTVRLVSELVQLAQAEPAKDEAFRKCAQRVRRDARTRAQDQVREQIQLAQQLGRDDDVTRLLGSLQQLMRETTLVAKEE